jgi:hypothetical protein
MLEDCLRRAKERALLDFFLSPDDDGDDAVLEAAKKKRW